jgi:DASS family divalent anion:Na+ symporter
MSVIFSNSSSLGATIGLCSVYFLLMYIFSSMTAHVIAFAGPFLNAAKALGCPPQLTVAMIAYSTSLCGCLTNYSSGATVLYFSRGYVGRGKFMAVGLLVGIVYLGTMFSIGLGWWKVLGWW